MIIRKKCVTLHNKLFSATYKRAMTLHIFNPDHDLALASGLVNFTAPHAGRQLRHDQGWLPAIWATEGDEVLVDNEEQAVTEWRRTFKNSKHVAFRQKHRSFGGEHREVSPWGWNAALRTQLLRLRLAEECIPTYDELQEIRQLSHRRTAAWLLPQLRMENTLGQAEEYTDASAVERIMQSQSHIVLKAPWSSSGRGIRFFRIQKPTESDLRWMQHVVERQGSIMIEPLFNKAKDFAMEFYSDGQGNISCLGLSLFHTENGAYTGNIIATEQRKREILNNYLVRSDLPDLVQERICQLLGPLFNGKYQGPFGVDMMTSEAMDLHPCVEINLRRTMGHVALAAGKLLNPNEDDDIVYAMHIDYTNNKYKLRIKRL